MKYFVGLAVVVFFALMCALVVTTRASADITEGHLGISLQTLPGDQSWGLDLAVPLNTSVSSGHFAGHVASGGGITRGRYHAEIGKQFDSGWEILASQDTTFKNRGGATGRDSDLGAGIEFPETDLGEFHITGGVLIAGRNSGAFGPPSAYDVLESEQFDLNELDEYPILQELHPAKTGLSLDARNAVIGVFYWEGQHPEKPVRWKVKVMPEFISDAEFARHQLLATLSWMRNVKGVQFGVSIDLSLQTYDGVIEHEHATRLTGSIPFAL